MNEPVKDGICQRGIGNAPVPLGNRDLGGNQGGGVAKAIIEDFQEYFVHPGWRWHRASNHRGPAELHLASERRVAGEGTITADLGEGVQQTGSAVVAHGEAIANCCVAKRGSSNSFSPNRWDRGQ